MDKTIAVIGGGASGMAAAISAAEKGAKVLILERNQRTGKKILATGNGRCNFTNINIHCDHYVSENIDIVKNIIEQYNTREILNFFRMVGVDYAVEQGRIYPRSYQAAGLLDCMRNKIKALGVTEIVEFCVNEIKKEKNNFIIISERGKRVVAYCIIVSAGGCAYPHFGTDGKIYHAVEELGHSMIKPYPALVALASAKLPKYLRGIRVKCHVHAKNGEDLLRIEQGEVQFTEYGLSGIAVMECSYLYQKYKALTISLDLFPEYEYSRLFEFLSERKNILAKMDTAVGDFFTGLINKYLGKYVLEKSGLHQFNGSVLNLTKNEIHQITKTLKNLAFKITETRGFSAAQVSGGGFILSQFDKNTLESKIVKNMYCCGEMLDVFGDCGGYNLHWAWASGIAAGKSAGEKGSICLE